MMCSKGKIVVAMSGGVDSSVAAALLLDEGYDVYGVTFIMRSGECRAAEEAEAVCRELGIPHTAADASASFKKYVTDAFRDAYMNGLTPNPCVECNRRVKIPLLLEFADKLGGDIPVATGHYARVCTNAETGFASLMRAADLRKDQSYMLYGIDRDVLRRINFPLGALSGKAEVRGLAKASVPLAAERPDSQDICFIPDGDYAGWLLSNGASASDGDYLNGGIDGCGAPLGDKIGTHSGHIKYTTGQRKGLGVAFGHPVFVVGKDAAANTVTLGEASALSASEADMSGVNYISIDKIDCPTRCGAKIRYAAPCVNATAYPCDGGKIRVVFDEPVRAVTPGQSMVLYDGDILLCGGIIINGKQ